MTDSTYAVMAEGLGKRFGERWVLKDVDLAVPAGSVIGLLGPNGAGKTTTVRILTTLFPPDAGRATVAGFDVVKDAARVRPHIGLAGQSATVDELLTGRGNLEMIARLYHLPRKQIKVRAAELLDTFDLTDAGDRLVKTYSGGMRRRLDLAGSLVARPPVLFLDEPTTGLDPRSRDDLWKLLRGLVSDGTTLLLTTQYMEEADALADDIAVIDGGSVIESGTPDELKLRVGGRRIAVTVRRSEQLAAAAEALTPLGEEPPGVDAEALQIVMRIGPDVDLVALLRRLDEAGVETEDVGLRRPTLDDVFLTLTGHDTRADDVAA